MSIRGPSSKHHTLPKPHLPDAEEARKKAAASAGAAKAPSDDKAGTATAGMGGAAAAAPAKEARGASGSARGELTGTGARVQASVGARLQNTVAPPPPDMGAAMMGGKTPERIAAEAKLGAVGAQAIPKVADAAATLAQAGAKLEGVLPQQAEAVGKLAGEVGAVAQQPPPFFGPLRVDVNSLADKATSLCSNVKDTLAQAGETLRTKAAEGLELLKQGRDKLKEIGDGLDKSSKVFGKEMKKEVIDDPIERMKPGDEVSITGNGEGYVAIPGLNGGEAGAKALERANTSLKVKANDDGSYTVRDEVNVNVGVGGGGNAGEGKVDGDATVGGGTTTEYKVDPVFVKGADGKPLMKDGKPVIDDAATKEKVKQLTDLIVNPKVEYPHMNPAVAGVRHEKATDLRTPAEKKLMDDCYVAQEFRGNVAQNVAASIGVPNVAAGSAGSKGQGEFTLRIEKGQVPQRGADGKKVPTDPPEYDAQGKQKFKETDGIKVTTSVSVATEVSGDVSGNQVGPVTVHADGKQANKVTLNQTVEFVTKDNGLTPTDLVGLRNAPRHVSGSVTYETETQLGAGVGVGGDGVVVKAGAREMNRVGMTTQVTVELDNPEKDAARVVELARQNRIADAAEVAGDMANVKVETTVYTERSRVVEGEVAVGEAGGGKIKVEAVERRRIDRLATEGTPSDLARLIKKQAEELQRHAPKQPVPMA